MSDIVSDVASIDVLVNIDLLRNPRASLETRRQAANYLADHPNKVTIPVIIKALNDPDYEIRKSALRACSILRSPLMVDTLVQVSRERSFSEREEAVRILGDIGDRRGMDAIAEALEVSDWMSIRAAAALALGKMKLPECVPPLIEGLKDPEMSVRANAADSLGMIGDERAVEPLIGALKTETGWSQRHIASALGKIGKPSMMPLVNILANNEEEGPVREAVTETLADIINGLENPAEIKPAIKLTVDLLVVELPTRDAGIRSYVARSALTRMSSVINDQLIQAFANSDHSIRDQVAYILGDSKDEALNDNLIKALSVANERVAAGAARVLYFRGLNPRDYGYTGSL